MTTLAVIAILSGLGAASFAGVSARTRVVSEATDLLNAIELTRSEASKRGMRVTILPVAGDWAAGWTVFADVNGNRQVDAGEPVVLRHQRLKPSTRIVTDTTPGYIAFGSGGMPQQYSGAFLAGTLAFCDNGSGRSVVLAKSGRPRITTIAC